MRVEVKERETVKGGEKIKVKNAVQGRGKSAFEEESSITGKKIITLTFLMDNCLFFFIFNVVYVQDL